MAAMGCLTLLFMASIALVCLGFVDQNMRVFLGATGAGFLFVPLLMIIDGGTHFKIIQILSICAVMIPCLIYACFSETSHHFPSSLVIVTSAYILIICTPTQAIISCGLLLLASVTIVPLRITMAWNLGLLNAPSFFTLLLTSGMSIGSPMFTWVCLSIHSRTEGALEAVVAAIASLQFDAPILVEARNNAFASETEVALMAVVTRMEQYRSYLPQALLATTEFGQSGDSDSNGDAPNEDGNTVEQHSPSSPSAFALGSQGPQQLRRSIDEYSAIPNTVLLPSELPSRTPKHSMRRVSPSAMRAAFHVFSMDIDTDADIELTDLNSDHGSDERMESVGGGGLPERGLISLSSSRHSGQIGRFAVTNEKCDRDEGCAVMMSDRRLRRVVSSVVHLSLGDYLVVCFTGLQHHLVQF